MRSTRALTAFLGVLALGLILASPGFAGTARVRALAAGDASLLPDDDGNIMVFPNRLSEHHRIILNNIAPDGYAAALYDSSAMGMDILRPTRDQQTSFENADSWAEASWGMGDATWQVGLNRPTRSRFQGEAYAGTLIPTDNSPAHSILDIGYATGNWGALVNFGMESATDLDTNWFVEGTFGTTMGDGNMEAALDFSANAIGDETLVGGGVNVRNTSSDGGFFNHWIGGVNFDNGADWTRIGFNGKLFHYNGDDHMDGGLVTLVAVGVDGHYLSPTDGDSFTVIGVPSVTAGAEHPATGWLDVRGSVSREYMFASGGGNSLNTAGDTSVSVGAAGHWGDMCIDAVVKNQFFENGPDFVGGNGNGVASFVSMTVNLD